MLTILVPGEDLWDETNEEFVTTEPLILRLEHSLVSLSKWESITGKPFLTNDTKTHEEIKLYVDCMIIEGQISPGEFSRLTTENYEQINAYIESPQSATTFGDMPERAAKREIITSELIYYWLVAFNIPFEVEHWHLNRLFSLIKIANIKNTKQKPMPRAELARRNAELNARRKAEYGTTG